MRATVRRAGILIAAVATAGCRDSYPTQPYGEGRVASADAGPLLRSAGGLLVSQGRMRTLLAGVTRDLALAFRDPQVRAAVYQRLHASPHVENKLHFRELLSDVDSRVLSAITEASGLAPSAVFAALDSLVDLEFYLPVEEHFQKWVGEFDVIVASLLDDVHSKPVAYDPTGREVLIDIAVPPSKPTFSLVPAETDFSRPPSKARRAPQGSASTVPAGIYMTRNYLNDLHEPFLMGYPEIELHAFVRSPAGGQATDISCAGAEMPFNTYRSFDQNDKSFGWFDPRLVMAVSADDLSSTSWPHGYVSILIWEDDANPCRDTAPPDNGRPPAVDGSTAGLLDYLNATVYKGCFVGEGCGTLWDVWLYLNFQTPLAYVTGGQWFDDLVGVMDASPWGCYLPEEASGPVRHDLMIPGSGTQGEIYIDVQLGARSPICQLQAFILGPTAFEIGSGSPVPYPAYSAYYHGRTGTPSYEWRLDGVLVGTAWSYDMWPVGAGTYTLQLKVTIGSDIAYANLPVEVSNTCNVNCGGGGQFRPQVLGGPFHSTRVDSAGWRRWRPARMPPRR